MCQVSFELYLFVLVLLYKVRKKNSDTSSIGNGKKETYFARYPRESCEESIQEHLKNLLYTTQSSSLANKTRCKKRFKALEKLADNYLLKIKPHEPSKITEALELDISVLLDQEFADMGIDHPDYLKLRFSTLDSSPTLLDKTTRMRIILAYLKNADFNLETCLKTHGVKETDREELLAYLIRETEVLFPHLSMLCWQLVPKNSDYEKFHALKLSLFYDMSKPNSSGKSTEYNKKEKLVDAFLTKLVHEEKKEDADVDFFQEIYWLMDYAFRCGFGSICVEMVFQRMAVSTAVHHLIEFAVRFMKKCGIRSKTAQYFIVRNIISEQKSQTGLLKVVDFWLQEKKNILEIHRKAISKVSDLGGQEEMKDEEEEEMEKEKVEKSEIKKSIFFVVHVLHLLVYKKNIWERTAKDKNLEKKCEYKRKDRNFITSLVEGSGCQCLCYTSYVKAAAEEFGYDYVVQVETPGHTFTGVMGTSEETEDIAGRYFKCKHLYGTTELDIDNELFPRSVSKPSLCFVLDQMSADLSDEARNMSESFETVENFQAFLGVEKKDESYLQISFDQTKLKNGKFATMFENILNYSFLKHEEYQNYSFEYYVKLYLGIMAEVYSSRFNRIAELVIRIVKWKESGFGWINKTAEAQMDSMKLCSQIFHILDEMGVEKDIRIVDDFIYYVEKFFKNNNLPDEKLFQYALEYYEEKIKEKDVKMVGIELREAYQKVNSAWKRFQFGYFSPENTDKKKFVSHLTENFPTWQKNLQVKKEREIKREMKREIKREMKRERER